MNINIDDYVTEEEKREIARDVFRDKCQKMSKDRERVLSNEAYAVVRQMIDEQIDGDVEKIIRDKAVALIDELCVYTAFKSPDYWSNSSKGYEVLQDALKANEQLAKDKITLLIESLDAGETRELIKEVACDLVDEKLFGKEQTKCPQQQN